MILRRRQVIIVAVIIIQLSLLNQVAAPFSSPDMLMETEEKFTRAASI
eukprot:CAMPEP_0198151310 /NCGR_PEP_ID=MMETSP1443-20131203/55151_1 /TAXON_ID=186043 /ORGANISM="Entomoneis sp., Strain CCMP2396" /LENGTH=47 /DNA_ID= /DNA_START= /DNA_END= /DNA_ORIENTATION=